MIPVQRFPVWSLLTTSSWCWLLLVLIFSLNLYCYFEPEELNQIQVWLFWEEERRWLHRYFSQGVPNIPSSRSFCDMSRHGWLLPRSISSLVAAKWRYSNYHPVFISQKTSIERNLPSSTIQLPWGRAHKGKSQSTLCSFPLFSSFQNNELYPWDFPGAPVVKTLCFQCREHGFDPGRGTKIPHAVWPKIFKN